MKKKLFIFLVALFVGSNVNAQWKAVGDRIKTVWSEQVNPSNVLPEYPRPQMVRENWKNLNGLWQYAITPKGLSEPQKFDNEILVPFAIESSLSGVQKEVGDANDLWYKKSFDVPKSWKNKSILLHFGAVDWRTEVFINDILIGSHEGGYTPFSFEITPYLNGMKNQKICLRVWDPTNKGYQPVGKQTSHPGSIWYTSVTGIWQTVWIEPVSENHITTIKAIPNIDTNILNVKVNTSIPSKKEIVKIDLIEDGKVLATAKSVQGQDVKLFLNNPKLWSPESPSLYDLKVSLLSGKETIDEVKSYTAFRKISSKRDKNGIMRMQLNNKDYFQMGTLDQGWWPDGLYTAPTDEALLFDIQKTKQWGFNMIRKHVKVEPARWYYHCDKEGMLVWQDMPSGDTGNAWSPHAYNGGTDKDRSDKSIADYYSEWKEIMDCCMSYPCIVIWVPFNESWGQFDTEKVANWTKKYDPSRLVNPASGGNYRDCGDILDLHNYPGPSMYLFDVTRVNVLGEYGGIGMPVSKHIWQNDRNWGYIQFKNKEAVTEQYEKYAKSLKDYVQRGFSASVYTQTTDVEGEINGLMTYDRKVIKIDENRVRAINKEVIESIPAE